MLLFILYSSVKGGLVDNNLEELGLDRTSIYFVAYHEG